MLAQERLRKGDEKETRDRAAAYDKQRKADENARKALQVNNFAPEVRQERFRRHVGIGWAGGWAARAWGDETERAKVRDQVAAGFPTEDPADLAAIPPARFNTGIGWSRRAPSL